MGPTGATTGDEAVSDKKTLRDLPDVALSGKRVLVRVDYNVPLEGGHVADDTRITATLPTLEYLVSKGARTILISHLGRPKGKWDAKYSLAPVARALKRIAPCPVHFVGDIVGAEAHSAVDSLAAGELLLLENLRFLPGEETNDYKLCEALAAYADVFVNDAFGAAHRAHASTSGVVDVLRTEHKPAVAGLLLEKELQFLGAALENPERPFVAILGGAKISGKIDVIENLLPRVERLLIGGAMANTFFRALDLETGASLVEEDRVELARDLLKRGGDKLVLPVDCVTATEISADAPRAVLDRDRIPAQGNILDIGPRSVALFREMLEPARTVLWNGPMGMFEIEAFSQGTMGVARAVAEATARGAVTIIGGGDTAAAVDEAGLADKMTHVSTGGGASLEFLEGKPLPGVEALDDR